jgi:hypothetical protein
MRTRKFLAVLESKCEIPFFVLIISGDGTSLNLHAARLQTRRAGLRTAGTSVKSA